MKAETLDPGSFEVTFVTIVDLMGSLLTSDNVTSVRCVVNEPVTMRTLFHSMFPLVISELSKVTGNKITGITSMLTGDFIIHTVVALITGVSITRRNWVNTFIVKVKTRSFVPGQTTLLPNSESCSLLMDLELLYALRIHLHMQKELIGRDFI